MATGRVSTNLGKKHKVIIERETSICGVPGFFVHLDLGEGKRFVVSCKETGFSVPGSGADTPEIAIKNANKTLEFAATKANLSPAECMEKTRKKARKMWWDMLAFNREMAK